VGEYVGGYSDWVRQRPRAEPAAAPKPTAPKREAAPAPAKAKKRKLSFNETKELADLPARIDALDAERQRLYAVLADPAVLRDGAATTEARAALERVERESEAAIARWEALETIASEG